MKLRSVLLAGRETEELGDLFEDPSLWVAIPREDYDKYAVMMRTFGREAVPSAGSTDACPTCGDHRAGCPTCHGPGVEGEGVEDSRSADTKGRGRTPEVVTSPAPSPSTPDVTVEAPRPRKDPKTGFPTRNNVLWYTPAEAAIRRVMLEVEEMGASVSLTNAVNALADAQAWVADHVEGVAPEDHYPRSIPSAGSTANDASLAADWARWALDSLAITTARLEALGEPYPPDYEQLDRQARNTIAAIRERLDAVHPSNTGDQS